MLYPLPFHIRSGANKLTAGEFTSRKRYGKTDGNPDDHILPAM